MANNKSALLVMDVQQGIVEMVSGGSKEFLTPWKNAIQAGRNADIPVMYVRVGFRSGYPEVSANNQFFSAITTYGGFVDSESSTQVHPEVAPHDGDLVVVKRRVSAFTGSDLEVALRSKQIDTLVLTGISTSGVVLSTLREASDKDYKLIVLSDACADHDEEVHRVLTEKVFPSQAQVTTVAEWAQSLGVGMLA
ncbi:cysteine hydrolase family protein [Alicyclobacillus dauci]|uniref:Cysteine hydrolase n=1 Tax=Alicyclobacillus dauci TaxID=1475485 RepID=A0ABY6Z3T5_9BACL|nr:isochorismatase family cysteine hydrolase [Alicyclobacillus dauci]WAH36944.1 cysteine hydrolase [Alicyclobacillus dauci]